MILIGFMGSGKTTIGKLAARTDQRRFLDTDELIVEREGRDINTIFAENGEVYFRDCETQVLKDLLEENLNGCVISVGGGLPVREENRALLKQLGTVIYLTASVDTLVGRLTGSDDRPMLQGHDLRGRILELMDKRGDLYLDAADVCIATDSLNKEDAAAACIGAIGNRNYPS